MSSTKSEIEKLREKLIQKVREDLDKAARVLTQKMREPAAKHVTRKPEIRKKAG